MGRDAQQGRIGKKADRRASGTVLAGCQDRSGLFCVVQSSSPGLGWLWSPRNVTSATGNRAFKLYLNLNSLLDCAFLHKT